MSGSPLPSAGVDSLPLADCGQPTLPGAITLPISSRSGVLRVGDVAQVYSCHASAWFDGKITELLGDGTLRVQYTHEGQNFRKKVALLSELLRIPATATETRSILESGISVAEEPDYISELKRVLLTILKRGELGSIYQEAWFDMALQWCDQTGIEECCEIVDFDLTSEFIDFMNLEAWQAELLKKSLFDWYYERVGAPSAYLPNLGLARPLRTVQDRPLSQLMSHKPSHGGNRVVPPNQWGMTVKPFNDLAARRIAAFDRRGLRAPSPTSSGAQGVEERLGLRLGARSSARRRQAPSPEGSSATAAPGTKLGLQTRRGKTKEERDPGAVGVAEGQQQTEGGFVELMEAVAEDVEQQGGGFLDFVKALVEKARQQGDSSIVEAVEEFVQDQAALKISREIRDRQGEGNRLGSLGNTHCGLGQEGEESGARDQPGDR